MKKHILKTLGSRALAAAIGAAMMIQANAPVIASAAQDKTEYISDVYISYGKDDESAKRWLEDNGYTVVDQNLNEKAEGGISFLGLGSEARSVYLGYKTTTDSDKAIRDMRVMNMDGKYSYDEYEKVLEAKKTEIRAFVADMKAALSEYRENYKSGSLKGKIAHDKLNMLTDDDCKHSPLGDLLLRQTKEEMTDEKYSIAPEEHADMSTLVLQGNITSLGSVMSSLMMASDTSKDSWITRLKQVGSFDAFYKKYSKMYPNMPESKVMALMQSDYDEKAKVLAGMLADLKESIKAYTECPVNNDTDPEKAAAYFKEHTDKSELAWNTAGVEYLILKDIPFNGATLADAVTGNEYDFNDPEDRVVLYPIIDSFSPGQRALLSYISFGEMLITGTLNDDGWKQSAEKTAESIKNSTPESVYAGIDRSLFQPAGVALTSKARQIQSATGASYDNRLLGVDRRYFEIAGVISGIILVGAGAGSLIYANCLKRSSDRLFQSYNAPAQLMESKKEVAANKFTEYLLSEHLEYVEGKFLSNNSPQSLKNEIFDMFVFHGPKDPDNVVSVTKMNRGHYIPQEYKRSEMINKFTAAKEEYKVAKDEYEQATAAAYKMYDDNEQQFKNDEILAEKLAGKSKTWSTVGKVLCIAGAIIAIGSAVVAVYDTYKYYHRDYAPIPRRIVDESSDEDGRSIFTIYDCTLCNRASQGFRKDELGDYGDLNGDVGKQWLALYTTKDKAAGDPITTNIITQKGSNKVPSGMTTGIRLFDQTDTVNLVSTEYCYNDKLGGLYVFCASQKPDPSEKTDTSSSMADSSTESSETEASSESSATAAASVVGAGTLTLSCVGSAAVGALICFLIVRRKKSSRSE